MTVIPPYQLMKFVNDLGPVASSSTADTTVGNGTNVSGWDRALVVFMLGNATSSDGTFACHVEYDSGSNTPSDCNSYGNFSTNVIASTVTYTSDANNGDSDQEYMVLLDIDLIAHSVLDGCIRCNVLADGTNTGVVGGLIILYKMSAGWGNFTQYTYLTEITQWP